MIITAAEMVINLQWPDGTDLSPQLNRLRDSFLACFDYRKDSYKGEYFYYLRKVFDGMDLQALHLGRAYCALRWVLQSNKFQQPSHHWLKFYYWNRTRYGPDLANVVRNLAGEPTVICSPDQRPATKWSLQVIPSIFYADADSKHKHLESFLKQFDDEVPTLNMQSFTDYLFCIYCFLSTVHPCDMGWMDKR
jgi:hypothetical protein